MSKMRLMEGDWVYCDGAEAFIRLASGHRLMVQHKFGSFDKFLNVANIEPIPLTAEILVNWFGFELKQSSGVFEGWAKGINPVTRDYLIYLKRIKDGTPFFYRNGHYEIQYVHQLQHLYEALTGEQLERIDI